MSYEDLKAARAKRAGRERTKEFESKDRSGRKRKAIVLEARESSDDVAQLSHELASARGSMARMTEASIVANEIVLKSYTAPMARMV